MSADNEVAIIEAANGFFVSHIQASDNLTYNAPVGQYNDEYVEMLFGNAIPADEYSSSYEHYYCSTLEEANALAKVIEQDILDSDCPIVEYGIVSYPDYPKDISIAQLKTGS